MTSIFEDARLNITGAARCVVKIKTKALILKVPIRFELIKPGKAFFYIENTFETESQTPKLQLLIRPVRQAAWLRREQIAA